VAPSGRVVKRLLRDPLFHFAVIGIALFAVFRGSGGWDGQPGASVRVSAADVGLLEARWEQQWGRSPSAQEAEALIESHVREEILYREALSLGLDRNDTIIRRRLAQKMEFLASEASEARAPGDDELVAFLAQHPERFRVPGRVTFEQIYFGGEAHGDKLGEVADAALQAVRAGESVEGDRFLLARHQQGLSDDRVGQVFGDGFGKAVMALAPGDWQGPIVSSYGLHLVFVEENHAARAPSLNEVRDFAVREWEDAQREKQAEAFYRELRARYRVQVDAR